MRYIQIYGEFGIIQKEIKKPELPEISINGHELCTSCTILPRF